MFEQFVKVRRSAFPKAWAMDLWCCKSYLVEFEREGRIPLHQAVEAHLDWRSGRVWINDVARSRARLVARA